MCARVIPRPTRSPPFSFAFTSFVPISLSGKETKKESTTQNKGECGAVKKVHRPIQCGERTQNNMGVKYGWNGKCTSTNRTDDLRGFKSVADFLLGKGNRSRVRFSKKKDGIPFQRLSKIGYNGGISRTIHGFEVYFFWAIFGTGVRHVNSISPKPVRLATHPSGKCSRVLSLTFPNIANRTVLEVIRVHRHRYIIWP